MRYFILVVFLIILVPAIGQTLSDTLRVAQYDSMMHQSVQRADSITRHFQSKADSLQQAYTEKWNAIAKQRSRLQQKIDSMTNLQLPTGKLNSKLDSLQQLQQKTIGAWREEVTELKSKVTSGFREVTLPPQMQEPLNSIKQSINNYTIGDVNSNLPSLPDVSLSQQLSIPQIPSFQNDLGKLTELSGQVKQWGGYGKDIQSLAGGNLDQVKNIDKKLEEEALQRSGANELSKQASQFKKDRPDSAMLVAMAKEALQPEINKSMKAINHFAGKEELLKEAMTSMESYKKKYSDVNDIAQLPKRAPNPLKGKPFFTRVVPGITFQTQNGTNFLLDINLYAQYKIRPRWEAGIGWVERLAFEEWNRLNTHYRAYGWRASGQYNIGKGFGLRVLPERINTLEWEYTPSGFQESENRQWVWNVMFGLRKEFTVYKNLKGNTEALYNLSETKITTLYRQKLMVRFGFEWPVKSNHDKKK